MTKQQRPNDVSAAGWATPIPVRRLVGERAAADRLGVSARTLQTWRWKGGGPPFVRLGSAIRYDLATLDGWVASNTRTSTSDPGPAAA